MRSFVRDLASVVFSKGALVIFGLAKSIILARWLGPENVGLIMALAVYPSLFMSFGSLGIRQATTYFTGKQLYSEDAIKRAIVQIWCLSTVVSLAACYWLVRHVSQSGEALLLVVLAIAPIPFTLFNQYNQGLFLGRNDIQAFNRINWLPSLVILAATGVLVVGLDAGVPGAMLAAIAGPVFMSGLLGVKHDFLRSVSLKVDWKLIRQLLSLGMVYAFSLLVINLNYKVDVILLDQFSTEYQIGIYSKGASLIEYLWQIPMLLSTIIFARSATAKDDARFSRKTLQLLRVSLLAIGLASIVLMVLANPIITLLFGEAFLPSGRVLAILLPGVLLLTFFKVLNMDLAGKGKPWVSLKAMAPALVVNVALNILWIPEYGADGAALASTISYSTAALLFLYVYSREVHIPIREIVRYRRDDFAPLRQLLRAPAKRVLK